METSPQRRARSVRALSQGAVFAVAMVLTACGSTPDSAPDRTAFPGAGEADGPYDSVVQLDLPDGVELTALDEDIDASLYSGVRRGLAARDWLAAHLALPMLAEGSPDTADAGVAAWHRYYQARIALLRGDLQGYSDLIGALQQPDQQLPARLAQELHEHQLDVAALNGNALEQFEAAAKLARASGHSQLTPAELEASLWQAAQQIDGSPMIRDARSRAWLELGRISRLQDPQREAAALNRWLQENADHPARSRAQAFADAAALDTQTARVALLLPLSGSLEKAGDAVSRGFLAAYFQDEASRLSIDVIDSRRYPDTITAYRTAVDKGADIVVGPLGKLQVEEVLAVQDLKVPLLTLNRPEKLLPATGSGRLMLSLAPEDEAVQLAEQAYAEGARRVLLLRPQGSWGDRMEQALRMRWEALGGHTPARAVYAEAAAYSALIRDALSLDASAARTAQLRGLFNEKIETSGRRRNDLDAIFLLSRNSEEARALKPLINYHYAGDLPTFALSTADSGSNDKNINGDLSGLRMLAMPWRLNEALVPGHEAAATRGSGAGLHALGADAYELARRWWRMRSDGAPLHRGLTAELAPLPDGTLSRRLATAEFEGGVLQPR